MSRNYKIRLATPQDEQEMLDLSRAVANEFTRSYLEDSIVDWYIDSGKCDEDIKTEIMNSTLLLSDEKIIGNMIWHKNQMHGFMIDSSYHGTGAAHIFVIK